MNDTEGTVVVRRHWNDNRRAVYGIGHLERLHWSEVSGGVSRRSPRAFVHAYVWCDGAIDGEVAHSGMHGPCPHRIKVCVVAKDNDRAVMEQLKKLATANDTERRARLGRR